MNKDKDIEYAGYLSANGWQICLVFMLAAVILAMPDVTLAADGDTIGDTLCAVVGWFTGKVGQGIATLAIIVVGVGALMGKISWGMAIIVGIGVAVIFGAATIVEELGADGAAGCSGAGG